MCMQPSQPHHQIAVTSQNDGFKCYGCKMNGQGERHKYKNHDYHKECWDPSTALSPEAYPGCTLKFLSLPLPGPKCLKKDFCLECRACDICGMRVKGFVYHCPEKKLDIHPRCAMLPRKIQVNDIKFELHKGELLSNCYCCNTRNLEGTKKEIPGLWYVSQCKEYSFHVYCLMAMGIKYGSNSAVGAGGSDDCKEYACKTATVNSLVRREPVNAKMKSLQKKPASGGRVRNSAVGAGGSDGCKEYACKATTVNSLVRREPVNEKTKSLQKKPASGGRVRNNTSVVKLFLTTVLSLIFGDPAAIMASVVVELLKG